MTFRQRLWDLLEVTTDSTSGLPVVDWYDKSFAILIVLNVVAVIAESVKALDRMYGYLFSGFELFSVSVFTVEYLLRLWACTVDPRYRRPVRGRIRYALSPMVIIDLLSFAPFYFASLPLDLRFLRVLRLFRLLRVLKLGRYSTSMALVSRVFRRKWPDLAASLIVLLVMLVMASGLMYYVERDAQPAAFSSIPDAMWWGVTTFTTVGYGDMYPRTPLGKLLGSAIAILGIAFFALPAGILSSGFSEERERHSATKAESICPHCGKRLD